MTRDLIDSLFEEGGNDDLDRFYPGSKRERRTEIERKPVVDEVSWDADSVVKRLPNGREVEMFTVGALATALGHSVVSIRRWERIGYIPKTPYRFRSSVVDGKRVEGRRLYTRALIESAVHAFSARGLAGKPRIDWSRHTDLPVELRETWEKIRVSETA